jgi:hypothetical protein
MLINRDHEMMNTAVLIGAFTAVLGSIVEIIDRSLQPRAMNSRWSIGRGRFQSGRENEPVMDGRRS